MKKLVSIMVCAAIMVMSLSILSGCGGNQGGDKETTPAGQNETQAVTEAAGPDTFVFNYKGTDLYIGEDAAVVEKLGEYKEKTETQSCAFEGKDTCYFYGSFYLTVGNPGDGKDVITAFWFTDDTVQTKEGLCIGDSKDKVEEIYGAEGFNNLNAYIYSKDICQLTIILENDAVSSIQYNWNK